MPVASNIGFFDLVDETLTALEWGDYEFAEAVDHKGSDKTAFIVKSKGLPENDLRIRYVGDFITTAIMEACPTEMKSFPDKFFGSTRKDGLGCFYIKGVDLQKVDFGKVRETVGVYKEMFRENQSARADLELDKDLITVGPFDQMRAHLFSHLVERTSRFARASLLSVPFQDGKSFVFAFNREMYLQQFSNEKTFSPVAFKPAHTIVDYLM